MLNTPPKKIAQAIFLHYKYKIFSLLNKTQSNAADFSDCNTAHRAHLSNNSRNISGVVALYTLNSIF